MAYFDLSKLNVA